MLTVRPLEEPKGEAIVEDTSSGGGLRLTKHEDDVLLYVPFPQSPQCKVYKVFFVHRRPSTSAATLAALMEEKAKLTEMKAQFIAARQKEVEELEKELRALEARAEDIERAVAAEEKRARSFRSLASYLSARVLELVGAQDELREVKRQLHETLGAVGGLERQLAALQAYKALKFKRYVTLSCVYFLVAYRRRLFQKRS